MKHQNKKSLFPKDLPEVIAKNLKGSMFLARGLLTHVGVFLQMRILPKLKSVLAVVNISNTTPLIGMVQYKTRNMDRAAFLMTLGAELLQLEGKYPENVFELKLRKWLFVYEKYIGVVRYKAFCENRKILKRRGRIQAGLPEHFTGEFSHGYKLDEIAVFRPFSKKEKARLGLDDK